MHHLEVRNSEKDRENLYDIKLGKDVLDSRAKALLQMQRPNLPSLLITVSSLEVTASIPVIHPDFRKVTSWV